MDESKAASAGRNDALDWLAERTIAEAATEVAQAGGTVDHGKDALRQLVALGTVKVSRILGLNGREGLTAACAEYAAAWTATVREALERADTLRAPAAGANTISLHVGSKRVLHWLTPEETTLWAELCALAGVGPVAFTLWVEHAPEGFPESMTALGSAFSYAIWLDQGTRGSVVLAFGVELADAIREAIETRDEWQGVS